MYINNGKGRLKHVAWAGDCCGVDRESATRTVAACATASAAPPPHRRVVITGMGVVSAFGNDADAFYDALLEGTSGVRTIESFDASKFSTRFAAEIGNGFKPGDCLDPKLARRLDRELSYAVVASKQALRMAGLDKQIQPEGHAKLDLGRAGVLVSSGMGGLTVLQDNVRKLFEEGYQRMSPFFIPYAITNMAAALVSIDQGFMGPCYSVSTACATSNYSMVMAASHIRQGDADVMLAGGAEAPVLPVGLGGFVACRALSQRNDAPQRASRPWDRDRDGFVIGEGAGVLVMESLEHALERGAPILAEYLGGALTCDAHHTTQPHPEGLGVGRCVALALQNAGVSDPEAVNYINAHATSTGQGDVAEVKALRAALPHLPSVKMNATKSMIGHALGAAGGLEAVAVIQAMRTGWVHPTLNLDNVMPEAEGLQLVPHKKERLDVNVALSNSFGFGGHNSVVVFAPYKA
ncbi:beta-ketoacyl synthase [Helicosporidium sp. ATCC 50920]|nr:beta-ketoacyl synthase [Helicosporidium sp. ATCC 50920]|eukprot:KDD75769.1 beta-ketoacyl synthase [Helicosporidium sp. ATCC 50920]